MQGLFRRNAGLLRRVAAAARGNFFCCSDAGRSEGPEGDADERQRPDAVEMPDDPASLSFAPLRRQREAVAPSAPPLPRLAAIAAPHVASFDALFELADGPGLLDRAVADIPKVVVFDAARGESPLADANRIELWISAIKVGKPAVEGAKNTLATVMYPAECRERGISYKAKMQARLDWRINNGPVFSEIRPLGGLPIMVRSSRCNLYGKSPRELIAHHEEAGEFGGYFVSNGIERLIRLLIVPRRNHPTALIRPSFQNRGPNYTKFGVTIRCVRPDQTSQTVTLHYCSDGAVTLRFSYRKNEYMVPILLVLRALCDASDREIFERITMGDYANTFLTDRLELLLRSFRRYGIYSRKQCLTYLGSKFAVMLDSPEDMLEEEVGLDFLRRVVLVHLTDARSKFDLIIFMLQKLYSLVAGDSAQDNPDSLQFQETLLAGHLFTAIIKEKLADWLAAIKVQIQTDLRRQRSIVDFKDKKYIQRVLQKTSSASDIGRKLEYFLSTGNLVSNSGLDLQQVSGYTIVAEKLNFYRYISHFRSIHRGSYFAELKTTTVRKLLPESYGFMCPVHTPDGAPCGLLNHLSHTCEIVVSDVDVSHLPRLIASLGASPSIGSGFSIHPQGGNDAPALLGNANNANAGEDSDDSMDDESHVGQKGSNVLPPEVQLQKRGDTVICIHLNGKVIGWCRATVARLIADTLREWKVRKLHNIPLNLEIGLVLPTTGGQYPGLFLFSSAARMIRPVKYLPTGTRDYIGPFEQVYMNIACMNEDIIPGITTHQDFEPTDMLSIVANMTPFCDFNQSPRNMYQCLTVDHDVLTRDGWRAIEAVQLGDEVLTFNTMTGQQEWNAVTGKIDLPHDGPLYRLVSSKMDAVATAEHRWLLNTKAEPTTWEYYTTQDALDNLLVSSNNMQWDAGQHVNHRMPMVGRNPNTLYTFNDHAFLPDSIRVDEAANLDWCRLIGFVLGNGDIEHTIDQQGHKNSVTVIRQSTNTFMSATYIEELLSRLQANAGDDLFHFIMTSDVNQMNVYRLVHSELYRFFEPMVRGVVGFNPCDAASVAQYDHAEAYRRVRVGETVECADIDLGTVSSARRWMYYDWTMLLSRSQARAIIKGFAAASVENSLAMDARDGSVLAHQNQIRACSSSLPLINDMSTIALLAEGSPKLSLSNTKATSWEITIQFDANELEAEFPQPTPYTNPAHNGRKYCVNVANSNFLARRRSLYNPNGAIEDVCMTPFFTGNCQMGKQTMGTPAQNLFHRTDNKLYRIQTGQSPIVRPSEHDKYGLDGYPCGVNAVVCVISYTGYDMEDASIISKSSHERGYAYGTVYKGEWVDLGTYRRHGEQITHHFGFLAEGETQIKLPRKQLERVLQFIDVDGLPLVGVRLTQGDPLYAYVDDVTGKVRVVAYKGSEVAYVDQVRLIGSDSGDQELQKIHIKLRIPRPPIIGDKFSSRHGQKGVISQKWPSVDMPFSETGIIPDVIINPHAFPSRMTIGMFVESLAGKSGALHGVAQDATPFKFNEDHTASEFFGEELREAGFNYYGNEAMYSGITGQEFKADIYIGVVFYQRLRHMVSDKFQVRTTGPVHNVTQQPVKGRKRAGGIRFGEMERDSLLAHGVSFLLQDRLMNCSDYSQCHVCRKCGSILGVVQRKVGAGGALEGSSGPLSDRDHVATTTKSAAVSGGDATLAPTVSTGDGRVVECVTCNTDKSIEIIAIPYVFRYLCAELVAMNVRLRLELE